MKEAGSNTATDKGDTLKQHATDQTKKIGSQSCVQCLNSGNRFCFIQFSKRDLTQGKMANTGKQPAPDHVQELASMPVSSGNGKCCYRDDLFSPGCDPVGIKSYQADSKYKDYTI